MKLYINTHIELLQYLKEKVLWVESGQGETEMTLIFVKQLSTFYSDIYFNVI